MSIIDYFPNDKEHNEDEAQHLRSAILIPSQKLQDIVEKGNQFISEHRDWLADFPHPHHEAESVTIQTLISTSPNTPSAHITQAPRIDLRAVAQCDSAFCVDAVNAATLSQLSIFSSSMAALTISIKLGPPGASAKTSTVTVSASATSNGSSADLLASSAISALNSLSSSASSAELSLSNELSIAQSRESAASTQAALALSSASDVLALESSIASVASASGAPALAQALSTAMAINNQTSTPTRETPSISNTTFALVIIFSIIGSSLFTGLGYYLIMRYRNNRRAAQRDQCVHCAEFYPHSKATPEVIPQKPNSEFPPEKSEEFDMSRASEWNFARADEKRGRAPSISTISDVRSRDSKRSLTKSTTEVPIIFDLGTYPTEKPPRFKSWLTESFKGWDRTSREIKAQKKKEESNEIRKVMVQKVRDGEERRENERKRKEDEEERERRRVENEEIERRVEEAKAVREKTQSRVLGGAGPWAPKKQDTKKREKTESETESEGEDSDSDLDEDVRKEFSFIGTAK